MEEQIRQAWSRYWKAVGDGEMVLAAEEFARAKALEGSRHATARVRLASQTTRRMVAPWAGAR